MSFLVALSFLISTWYFGSDIYLRQSPKIVHSQIQLDHFPMTNLSNETFFYAFALKHWSELFDDPTYIEYGLTHIIETFDKKTGKDTYKEQHYPAYKCNSTHAPEHAIKAYDLDTFYCADIKNFKFGGVSGEKNVAYLRYEINKCQNKTWKKFKCKTKEEINRKLTNLYLNTYTFIPLVNIKNYSHPVQGSYNWEAKSLRSFIRSGMYYYKKYFG